MAKDEASIHILRKVVIDGFLLGGMILVLTAINMLWEPFHRGFFCGDESLMFPLMDDTVTVPVLRTVGLTLPLVLILACEWALLRKEQDDVRLFGLPLPAWFRGFYCVSISFGIGACFSEFAAEIAKNTIGRNRPFFFEVCRPSVNCSLPEWQGRYIQAHEFSCTSDQYDMIEIINMRKSFVSGHSSWAAYTMVYLALYLERRMVWRSSRLLRHFLQFVVLMLSWYTALSRITDYRHHWSDVVAGYALGAVVAVSMFLGTDFVKSRTDHAILPQFEVNPNQISCCSRM